MNTSRRQEVTFGPTPWYADRTTKIHGDLDELFMSDIFPDLVMMYHHGIVGKGEMSRENLSPFYSLCSHASICELTKLVRLSPFPSHLGFMPC